jgi:hypothetical protein
MLWLQEQTNADHASSLIADAGGCELVIETMLAFPEDVDTQGFGCNCLANLAYNSVANVQRISQAGGVGAVMQAMRNHIDEPAIQSTSHTARRFFVVGLTMYGVVSLYGCTGLIGHDDHADVGWGALVNLSDEPGPRDAIVAEGAIELSVSSLMAANIARRVVLLSLFLQVLHSFMARVSPPRFDVFVLTTVFACRDSDEAVAMLACQLTSNILSDGANNLFAHLCVRPGTASQNWEPPWEH